MTKQNKSGGNVQKNVSDLLVPFGLMLAKESLESFLKKQKVSTNTKPAKKVSLSGGKSCGSSAQVDGFTKQTFATVGGKKKYNVHVPVEGDKKTKPKTNANAKMDKLAEYKGAAKGQNTRKNKKMNNHANK